MEYILFAFLALLCSAGTMIFDKLATKSISHLFSVFLRTLFMSVSSFIIILCFGHLGDMFNLSIEEWIYLVVSCLLCLSNCYFYFKAIKVAPIDSFSSFNQTGQLFFTNLLFLIFQFGAVINKDKPFSIVLYILGLVVLLGTMI